MATLDDLIIDALGGTTSVSRLTETPLSTVHSWRKKGIPRSRLAHLKLVGQTITPAVDVDALIDAASGAGSSPGNEEEVSAEASA